ncbi:hypothetical protein Tco_1167387 [Tanacetum coccineum]
MARLQDDVKRFCLVDDLKKFKITFISSQRYKSKPKVNDHYINSQIFYTVSCGRAATEMVRYISLGDGLKYSSNIGLNKISKSFLDGALLAVEGALLAGMLMVWSLFPECTIVAGLSLVRGHFVPTKLKVIPVGIHLCPTVVKTLPIGFH